MINLQEIRKLSKIKSVKREIVSLYLNCDQKIFTPKEIEIVLKDLLKEGGTRLRTKDKKKIKEYIKLSLSKKTKGLVFLISPEKKIWRVYNLVCPVKSKIFIKKSFYLRPLLDLLDEYERYCTVVVDKEKARIFCVFLGEIEEEKDLFKVYPGKHAQGGWSQRRFAGHIEKHLERHLKDVADKTYEFFRKYAFDRLIIAGSKEVLPKFIKMIHPYLRKRLAGQFYIEMFASLNKILKRSLAIEEKIERKKEEEIVKKLEENLGKENRAVCGLKATLKACYKNKILLLIVDEDFSSPGMHCIGCDFSSLDQKRCSYCGAGMQRVEDIVEELCKDVLKSGGKVEFVHKNRRLKKLGNIGALLRY